MVLKEVTSGKPAAEVGYWTAAQARGRGVASRALEALTRWAFDTFEGDGLERLELLHQVDNLASCRVAQKSRYDFDTVLPAAPPSFPREATCTYGARVPEILPASADRPRPLTPRELGAFDGSRPTPAKAAKLTLAHLRAAGREHDDWHTAAQGHLLNRLLGQLHHRLRTWQPFNRQRASAPLLPAPA